MKTSTLIFNIAAVIVVLAAFVALVDLMKNKTVSYGITATPVVTMQPTPVVTVVPVTAAPTTLE